MNGACLYSYVENGVVQCAIVVPWWMVGLFAVGIAVVAFWKATR